MVKRIAQRQAPDPTALPAVGTEVAMKQSAAAQAGTFLPLPFYTRREMMSFTLRLQQIAYPF